MAKFKARADLTKGPTFDPTDPSGTVMNGAKYAIGVGFMAFLLGIGFSVVAPLFGRLTSMVTGGRVSSNNDPLGGAWEDLM